MTDVHPLCQEGDTPLDEYKGFRVGDLVSVHGRTIGVSRIEALFTRQNVVGPTPKAIVRELDSGKTLDPTGFELREAF